MSHYLMQSVVSSIDVFIIDYHLLSGRILSNVVFFVGRTITGELYVS